MKVLYPGPGDTYHPKLGKLLADKLFDLDDEIAKKYVESGLLKRQKSEANQQSIRPPLGGPKQPRPPRLSESDGGQANKGVKRHG